MAHERVAALDARICDTAERLRALRRSLPLDCVGIHIDSKLKTLRDIAKAETQLEGFYVEKRAILNELRAWPEMVWPDISRESWAEDLETEHKRAQVQKNRAAIMQAGKRTPDMRDFSSLLRAE